MFIKLYIIKCGYKMMKDGLYNGSMEKLSCLIIKIL